MVGAGVGMGTAVGCDAHKLWVVERRGRVFESVLQDDVEVKMSCDMNNTDGLAFYIAIPERDFETIRESGYTVRRRATIPISLDVGEAISAFRVKEARSRREEEGGHGLPRDGAHGLFGAHDIGHAVGQGNRHLVAQSRIGRGVGGGMDLSQSLSVGMASAMNGNDGDGDDV